MTCISTIVTKCRLLAIRPVMTVFIIVETFYGGHLKTDLAHDMCCSTAARHVDSLPACSEGPPQSFA